MAEAVAETSKNEDLGISVKVADAKVDRPSNLCCYSQEICNLEKLKGFDFCHKHILEDKASPFKPCDFVAKSNERRCPNPAPKLPNRGKSFCIIHTRKAELRRAVEERRKRRRCDSIEGNYHENDKGKRRRTSSVNSQRSDKVDGHSSDDAGGSGEEYLKVDSAWHGGIDSDADSVDSEEEDPLKHAGVWTTEEATRICRDKMIRLRSLYIAQFKRLQHVLKERQRKYCQAIQAEEEEETGECHLTPAQLLGPKLQHERPGTEALLHRQAKEKRLGTTARQQNMPHLRCTFAPSGNRCNEKVLPLTKHCIRHITQDPHQLLYQRCSFPSRGDDSQCEMNAPKIFNHSTCRLHVELPGSMKRPHIKTDLLEAKERAKARLATLVETTDGGKETVLPEALHQKSSALIPPAISGQSDDVLPVSCQSPSSTAIPQSTETKLESASSVITDFDSAVSQKDSSAASSTKTEESSSTTLKSGESSVLASENISPGLAAASLVVVCSSPQAPLKGPPLASTSGVQQPSNTTFRDEDSKLPSSEVSRSDGNENDSQTVHVSEGESASRKAQETESNKTSFGDKTTVAKSSSLTLEISQESAKAAVTSEIKRSVVSSTDPLSAKQEISDGALFSAELRSPDAPQSALPSVPQGVKQGVKQGASHNAPQGASQGASQGVKQGASHNAPQGTSQDASQGALQGASQDASQDAPQSTRENASLGSSKEALQSSLETGDLEASVCKPLLKGTQQGESAASKALSARSIDPAKSSALGTSPSSTARPQKVKSAKPPVTYEPNRTIALKDFKHLPSGMTAATSKQYGSLTPGYGREISSKDCKTEKGSGNA